jgi:hypothetical protein
MRRINAFTTIFFVFLVIFFSSCKKADQQTPVNSDAEKISSWLDHQKSSYNPHGRQTANKDANIELLMENLAFNSATKGVLDDERDILLIPIKKNYATTKHVDDKSILSLLLFVDKLGAIKSGSIIDFNPAVSKGETALSITTLLSLLNQKKGQSDGNYKFLSVSARLLSQQQVKNGKLYSIGNVRRSSDLGASQRGQSCIDWYLVTTYYYSDGTQMETKEYLGTTCEECDQGEYATFCVDIEGGGGGSTQPLNEEQDSIKNIEAENSMDESSYEDVDYSIPENADAATATPTLQGVRYTNYVRASYNDETKEFSNLTCTNIVADPSSLLYTDKWSRRVQRNIVCVGTTVSGMQLSPTDYWTVSRATAYWSWVYINGDPSYARAVPVALEQTIHAY